MFPTELANYLKLRRFDLGIVPFNNMTGNGYGKVRGIALGLNMQKVVGINMENRAFDLSAGKVGTD